MKEGQKETMLTTLSSSSSMSWMCSDKSKHCNKATQLSLRKRQSWRNHPRDGFSTFRHVLPVVACMAIFLGSGSVDATPRWLLMNGIPKCLQMTGMKGMNYRLDYSAPDLDNQPTDGNARAPVVLRILHVGGALKTARGRWARATATTYRSRTTETHDIRSTSGSIVFQAENDGAIEICASSMLARPLQPMPVFLQIHDQTKADTRETSQAQAAEKEKQLQEGQENAERTLTVLEKSVQSLMEKIDLLIANAEYAQTQEKEFHEQTMKMHSATKWWPIGQLIVLLVTGVAQATLIARSFRKAFR